MTDERLAARLKDALRSGDASAAVTAARKALEAQADPLDLIRNVLVPTLTEVGKQFQEFEIFLPELMAAGDAAKAATVILEQAIAAAGKASSSLGTVVLGTVQNDVHDIGKNIVSTLLSSHGFRVVDIGRDVAPSAFLEAARREKAEIVAMSALMTTTRPAAQSTIRLFEEVEARDDFKIIVGGGSIDAAWAKVIGADGYAPDAASAVDLCRRLVGG